MKYIFTVFSLVFLVYLLLPGPTSINDFPALSNSAKSTLEGDTIQIPNVAAYFSDNYRDFATKFYRDSFRSKTWLPFPPLRINHPPEYAFTTIKVETQSTYLEEFYYPFRDSIFINGMEPFEVDGTPKYEGAIKFKDENRLSDTKVTIRYYPSPIWARVLTWMGIVISMFLLLRVTKKVVFNA